MTAREAQILKWIEENPMISQQELASRAGITRSSAAVHISNLMKKGYILGKGYVVQKAAYITVIGGVNIDICGYPKAPLVSGDSNPGQVITSLGGVGRNIAHNLSLLSVPVKLITAFGNDFHAARIKESCLSLGIDISWSLMVPEASTSTYLFITDEAGDMQLAVSDMDIYSHITPAFLADRLDAINHSSACVIDGNIPEESILYLAKHCTVPLFADPVSTKKAAKFLPVLEHLYAVKPNLLEAGLLSRTDIKDTASFLAAVDKLLEAGIQEIFLSLGSRGLYYAGRDMRIHLPCYPSRVRNTTGAGDSAFAAILWAYYNQLSMNEAAKAAVAASSICVESPHTINTDFNEDMLRKRMKQFISN